MTFLFSSARIESALANFGLLVLRAFAGVSLAVAHGLQKFPPSDPFIAGVAAMGFPSPFLFAWMATLTETFGGLALALGIATRPVAFVIAMNMAVVAFIRHAPDRYGVKELAFFYLATAIMFLCVGGGRFSLDKMFRRH